MGPHLQLLRLLMVLQTAAQGLFALPKHLRLYASFLHPSWQVRQDSTLFCPPPPHTHAHTHTPTTKALKPTKQPLVALLSQQYGNTNIWTWSVTVSIAQISPVIQENMRTRVPEWLPTGGKTTEFNVSSLLAAQSASSSVLIVYAHALGCILRVLLRDRFLLVENIYSCALKEESRV